MRQRELALLQTSYEPGAARVASSQHFAKAVGVRLPQVHGLHADILSSFEAGTYGVRWWGHLDSERRILIGDHLQQCILAIETNLVEARLHQFEYLGWHERHSLAHRDVVVDDGSGPRIAVSPRRRGEDDLPLAMIHLHIAGFFRSVSASFDCLAAAVVGVLGLKVNLIRADWGKLERAIESLVKEGGDAGTLGSRFSARMEDVLCHSGPRDWLRWSDGFRNLMAHRGRRMAFGQFKVESSRTVDVAGHTRLIASIVSHLPNDPTLSDVESMVCSSPRIPALTESSETTLEGIFQSTAQCMNEISEELRNVWAQRSGHPLMLLQPREQWLAGRATSSLRFRGYAPDSVPLSPSQGSVNTAMAARIRACALDDANIGKWRTGF